MPEREIGVSRKNFLRLTGLLTAAAVLESCRSPEPGPTPTSGPSPTPRPTGGPSPEISPTPTTPPTPEPTPRSTVVVETEGFGGLEELTEAERATASAFQEVYEEAAHGQDLAGTVVLTRGDEEGEIGAFFRDNQNNPWSLVTREETQVLEQVPLYDGVQAEWVPNEMRFEYLVEGKTFVYEPENRLLINEEGRAISQWNGETNQWEEVPAPTPEPTEKPEEESCVTENCEPYQEIQLYRNFSDQESFSILVPGTDKTFVVRERRNGRMLIEVTEPTGVTWEAWADDNPGAYGLVGQIPPTPEAPPYPACEVPHFGGRTPDRKTGEVIRFGNQRQGVYPDGDPIPPHYAWVEIQGINAWVTKKDGQITTIDREKGIITFSLGDLVVKKSFTSNTIVVMEAHETYRGMPVTESMRIGGNICDLEVGDAAAILHPSEAEGASPSPEGPLWGIYIVQ